MDYRYIGVLNVTFSKGPKPPKPLTTGASKNILRGHGQIHSDEKLSNGIPETTHHRSQGLSKPTEVADPPRIVSQSQQIGEVPHVILDQNRHIVPFSLFDSPERP